MKTNIILFLAFAILVACKEEPKNYVTLSGKITNKNSDSLFVRGNYGFNKAIKVAEDGSFSDTLKVDTDIYSIFHGNKPATAFLKNGFELELTFDANASSETTKFTGVGAEQNNFISEGTLLRNNLLNIDELSSLDINMVNTRLEEIKVKLNEFYTSNKSIDTFIVNSSIKSLDVILPYYKKIILQSIEVKTKLAKGTTSPSFENYENYKGGTTSLSDLKGKYVFIDVWATWCKPCIAEVPFLKEIEEKYHGKNIEFVSISIDEAKSHDKWKKMVDEMALGGMQLFAPKAHLSKFAIDYKIKGIPRFILIDPDGNIVTPDAPKPSNPRLVELFKELSI